MYSTESGDVDLDDFRKQVAKHKEKLSAFMITYPSTYGKFEEEIKTMIDLIHANGGQVRRTKREGEEQECDTMK